MSVNGNDFDWKTDSEEGWGSPSLLGTGSIERHRRAYKPYILVSLVIILFLTAGGVYYVLNQRSDQMQARLAAEVIDSHNLFLRAVEKTDLELFSQLVFDRPLNWHSLQQDLLRRGLVLDRATLGFTVSVSDEANSEWPEPTVQFSPDLETAVVVEQIPYAFLTKNNLSKRIYLERYFHYRRDEGSWSYAAPPDDASFWGDWTRMEGARIKLLLPQRDAEFGQIYLEQFDMLVGELCSAPQIDCPDDFQIQLRLDRQPRSLLRLGDSYRTINLMTSYNQYLLNLPTVSLIGRPVDEDGKEAVYQAYAGWLASVVINNFSGIREFADSQSMDNYLLRWKLREPLKPQPMIPLAAEAFNSNTSVLPEQDLLMLCTTDQQLNLWRYKPMQNQWLEEETGQTQNLASPFPSSSGAMLFRSPSIDGILMTMHQVINDESRWRSYLWDVGESRLLLDESKAYYYWPPLFFNWTDHVNGRITVFSPTNEYPRGNAVSVQYFDIPSCQTSICELQTVEGIPFWSSNSQYSVIMNGFDTRNSMLSLADAQGELLYNLDLGNPVGWLGSDRYAYILTASEQKSYRRESLFDRLVVRTIKGQQDTDEKVTIFAVDDLSNLLGNGYPIDQMEIDSALALDGGEGWIIVVSSKRTNDRDWQTYIVKYYPQQKNSRIISTLEKSDSSPVVLAQRGGHFAVVWRDVDRLNLRIFDIEEEEFLWQDETIPVDWSDDGDWLLFVEQRQLRLVAPRDRQEITIPYDLSDCYSAVWLN